MKLLRERSVSAVLLTIILVAVLYLEEYHGRSSYFHLDGRLEENGGCISMNEYDQRTPPIRRPSEYLQLKLDEYERLHRKCAPGAVHRLTQLVEEGVNSTSHGDQECKYVVWVNDSGLGNKMMTMVSTFVYALLTSRVMLVDKANDMDKLFCEPFANVSSWFVPSTMANGTQLIPQSWTQESSPLRYGTLLASIGGCQPNVTETDMGRAYRPSLAFLLMSHIYSRFDQRFFCQSDQKLLKRPEFLLLRSNNYFLPGMYFNPSFRAELEKMFPGNDRELIFHHIGRYMLHPTNQVWSRVTRFYDTYLSGSDLLVGLQLRNFDASNAAIADTAEQLTQCISQQKLLPPLSTSQVRAVNGHPRRVNVLITSLHRLYYDKLRDMYGRFTTEDGSLVGIYLPSNEQWQKTEAEDHDVQALTEIYLLSLADTLVTSPSSTFGYAAQSLKGKKSWMLDNSRDTNTSSKCYLVPSVDPCFHASPPYNCDCKGDRDTVGDFPMLRHCLDHDGSQLVLKRGDNVLVKSNSAVPWMEKLRFVTMKNVGATDTATIGGQKRGTTQLARVYFLTLLKGTAEHW